MSSNLVGCTIPFCLQTRLGSVQKRVIVRHWLRPEKDSDLDMARRRHGFPLLWVATLLISMSVLGDRAQAQQAEPSPQGSVIRTTSDANSDAAIRDRLQGIYAQIGDLSEVEVNVADGVVTLDGVIANQTYAQQAAAIANRVDGVVAVQNNISASVDVGERISPFFDRLSGMFETAGTAAPLFLLALAVFGVILALGWWVASWTRFWRRVSPNPFIGDLLAQAVRVSGFVLGVVIALNLIGASALMGTVLGGAGVVGLAIGFAVRDSLENYIASIMLSLRQPFRANDHVVVDGNEGKVVRLTSRATILMTPDGNHLRIPNTIVFKAVIINYTTNPERRLDFQLGVDANDDPQAAIETGSKALADLEFVLADPPPNGVIMSVGDSNIILKFTAWINQERADFLKARSRAIRATKMAVEAAGFTLPEPIYRLRIDNRPAGIDFATGHAPGDQPAARPRAQPVPQGDASVEPDDHLDEKIAEERRDSEAEDLLNTKRPVE